MNTQRSVVSSPRLPQSSRRGSPLRSQRAWLVLAALLACSFTCAATAYAGSVIVPDVLGKREIDAQDALEAVDLLADVTYVEDHNHPDGIVISQNPPAGTAILEQSKVTLSVNLLGTAPPANSVAVPKLVGTSYLDALDALQAMQLTADATRLGARLRGAVSTVLTQDPAAGTNVAPGSKVRFTHSATQKAPAAPKPGIVPDFQGMTEAEVTRAASAARLSLVMTGLRVGPGAASRATAQDLLAGRRVALGTRVMVDFKPRASGHPTGTGGGGGTTVVMPGVVPNFLGMTTKEARQAGRKANLSLTMKNIPIGTRFTPRATRQDTPAGTRVRFGAPVTVSFKPSPGGVGTGTPSTGGAIWTVPDFFGLTDTQAHAIAKRAGVQIKHSAVPSFIDPGVQWQSPAAGTVGSPGMTIVLDFTQGGTSGGAVSLPDFTGWTESRLDLWGASNSLTPGKSTVTPNARGIRRVVTRQFPPAGTPVRAVTRFSVVIGNERSSAGTAPTAPTAGAVLPSLVGRTEADFDAFMIRHGLGAGKSTTLNRPIPGVPRVVKSQSPAPGTPMSRITRVDVVIGNRTGAPGPGQVPNFVGQTEADFDASMIRLGLSAGKSTTLNRPIPGVPRVVKSQSPPPGTPLSRVGRVDVVIGNGTAAPPAGSIMVPAIGQNETAVAYMIRLNSIGLKPVRPKTSKLFDNPIGTSPAVGTSVAKGTRITLLF